jgi:hypothetical protein
MGVLWHCCCWFLPDFLLKTGHLLLNEWMRQSFCLRFKKKIFTLLGQAEIANAIPEIEISEIFNIGTLLLWSQ